MTHPKLELQNIQKLYGDDIVAVDDIDLIVDEGQTLALLGPSGCGKSTTLNMIVGLEEPTKGDIKIDGKSVIGLPPGKRNVGLVFQDYAVFTHMTVEQNLAFGLSIKKINKNIISKQVIETAELLGLTTLLKEKASRLGGSELQRVAIGRTLITRPSILLLDEPLSNLESEARTTMRQELRRLQSETNLTIIYVTHDQIEALSLADNVAVMNAGKICELGPTESVYEKPGHVFVAEFIGEPAMNIYLGKLVQDNCSMKFVSDHFSLDIPPNIISLQPGPIKLGIRPELIKINPSDENKLRGKVILVQPRGPEAVITIALRGVVLLALVKAEERPCIGEEISLHLLPKALSFFHNDTGINLLS